MVAEGTPGAIMITGRLFDGAGDPVPDGLIETWQAGPGGRFDHPDDPRGAPAGGTGFRGFGRCPTGPDGSYRIVTLRPGALPGPDGTTEAPHLDVSVFARGLLDRVVTRIYFGDEAAANAADPVLASITGEQRRATLIAAPDPARGPLFPVRHPSAGRPAKPCSSMSDQPVRLAASVDEGPPDAPLLVLGNSLGTTRELWSPQAAVLRRHFRLVQYEHRGHGGSPAPPGPYTIAGLARTYCGCSMTSGPRGCRYCGISLGGMVGMWLAAHAPERITALAVCCTTAHFPDQAFWAGRAATVRAGGLAPLAGQVVGRWFTPAFAARDPATPARFVATLRADVDPAG